MKLFYSKQKQFTDIIFFLRNYSTAHKKQQYLKLIKKILFLNTYCMNNFLRKLKSWLNILPTRRTTGISIWRLARLECNRKESRKESQAYSKKITSQLYSRNIFISLPAIYFHLLYSRWRRLEFVFAIKRGRNHWRQW